MGARTFVGRGAGAGVGAIIGFGVGPGFGPNGFPIGIGAGAGVGVGIGWGWMAGIGAQYIDPSPDFAEKHSRSHKQNPLRALEGQLRKVFKKPAPQSGHPVQAA